MGAIVQTAIVIALWLLALHVSLWITGAFTLGTIPKATRRLTAGRLPLSHGGPFR